MGESADSPVAEDVVPRLSIDTQAPVPSQTVILILMCDLMMVLFVSQVGLTAGTEQHTHRYTAASSTVVQSAVAPIATPATAAAAPDVPPGVGPSHALPLTVSPAKPNLDPRDAATILARLPPYLRQLNRRAHRGSDIGTFLIKELRISAKVHL